jgi:hypothetical protein
MTINSLTRCYELYRAQIQHEDMLLNQRGDLDRHVAGFSAGHLRLSAELASILRIGLHCRLPAAPQLRRALSLVMLLLLLMLVGVLPYKLSDWAPVRGRPMEEADEVTSSASNS